MNALQKKLIDKPSRLMNIYCTAGFPEKDSLLEIIPELELSGADMVEVGIPFSDPLADGPTIQESNGVALRNGITLELIFDQLKEIEAGIPIILMGYFNSILQYGIGDFCAQCKAANVSGVIVPDIPLDYYLEQVQEEFDKHELSMIFLVSPQTSPERRKQIDAASSSFIYAVSSSSTTGKTTGINGAVDYLDSLRTLHHPVLVGFNIATSEDVETAFKHCNGAIVGSAFIRQLKGTSNVKEATSTFMNTILKPELV